MDALFTTTNKRVNSTKKVTGGSRVKCTLLDPCSNINPRLRLNLSSYPEYNYVSIPEFNRSYFIDKWEFNQGFWIAYCSCDVLGTYAETIKGSTEYVARSASNFNGDIVDSFYPTTAQIIKQATIIPIPWSSDLSKGTYVVGVVGDGALGMGLVSYYTMTPAGFNNFGKILFSSSEWMKVEDKDIPPPVLKSQFNPLQYITSCQWFPFQLSGKAVSAMRLGWWDIPVGGGVGVLGSEVHHIQQSFTVPTHPQQPQRGYYLNLPPFARYTLNMGPFGEIPLDGTFFVKDPSLNIIISTDLISGLGVLQVFAQGTDQAAIRVARAKIGVNISITQLTGQFFQSAANAIISGQGMAVAAAGGNVTSFIAKAGVGVESAFNSVLPQVNTAGSNGDRSDYGTQPALLSQFFTVSDESLEDYGRPLMKRVAIGSLKGYTILVNCDIKINGTVEEQVKIKSLTEGGFFVE